MQRRTFMLLLGATAGLPLAASAQQKPMPVAGFLHSAAPHEIADLVAAFRSGVEESGFSEGQNAAIEYRYGDNQRDRLGALVEELVARKVDVIATGGGDRTAIAAKQKTSEIPIVSVIGGDPVAEGLVASLSHPGGNLTGVAFLTASLTTKRLELLLEIAPHAKVIALLANYGTNPQTESIAEDLRKAVLAKGFAFHILAAGTEAEIDKAFADMAALHADALVVQADPYFNNTRGRLVSLATRYAIPAIHERSAFVNSKVRFPAYRELRAGVRQRLFRGRLSGCCRQG